MSTKESTLQIVEFSVADLKPYERNPRRNDKVVEKMIESIDQFGFKIPILARSDGTIVDGHLRLKAALRKGLKTVPVILCDEWSDEQVKAFRLLANRSAAWAEWDEDLLRLEMQDLKAANFDLSLTGFEPIEIEALFKEQTQGSTGAADAPAPDLPEHPVSRAGDVWILGKHRLMCGDSTLQGQVETLLAGAEPNLMVTDPPYGVAYDPRWRLNAGINKEHQKRAEGKVTNDNRCDWHEAWDLFGGAIAYVWHGGLHAGIVAMSLIEAGFEIRSQIIWAKPSLVIGRGHYHWQHEPCWYAVRKGGNAHWLTDRKQSTVWEIANMHRTQGEVDDGKTVHATQKPIECMRRPMLNHTARGEAVYEPFCGSGSTIMAAETIDRACYAMEINPAYVDVAVKRWQDFTGKDAILEGDGRRFNELGERE